MASCRPSGATLKTLYEKVDEQRDGVLRAISGDPKSDDASVELSRNERKPESFGGIAQVVNDVPHQVLASKPTKK